MLSFSSLKFFIYVMQIVEVMMKGSRFYINFSVVAKSFSTLKRASLSAILEYVYNVHWILDARDLCWLLVLANMSTWIP